jgi:FkbM family methyltransferase
MSLSGENKFVEKVIGGMKNPVVIDVGAHTGDYSTKVKKENRNAKVFAFEPHSKTYEKLKKKGKKDNFYTIHSACGSREGKTTLYDYEEEGTSHASIIGSVINDVHNENKISFEVPITTLDSFTKSEDISVVDLLKIDTEGSEIEVIRGARKIINSGNIRCIQIEFNEMNVMSRTFLKDFVDLLEDYIFFRMLPDGLVKLGKYTPKEYEIFGFQNIVAINEKEKYILDKV